MKPKVSEIMPIMYLKKHPFLINHKLLKTFFSFENRESTQNKWYKVFCIFGLKISFRNKRKERRVAQYREKNFVNECLYNLQNQNTAITKSLEEQNKELKRHNDELLQILDHQTHVLEKLNNFNESFSNKINQYDRLFDNLGAKEYIPNVSIKHSLFIQAGKSTADYVLRNMPCVNQFDSPLDLLTFAISKVLLDGLFLEFGVYSGHTINHISNLKKEQIFYGFDSFEGLPEDWRSGFKKGAFAKNDLPPVNDNVKLVKGWFNETLPSFILEHPQRCAFIHIDCDIYSSTKTIFENLAKQIEADTIIVFDEYFNYPNWEEHEFKAFQEFVEKYNVKYEYIGYVEPFEQVAVRIISIGK